MDKGRPFSGLLFYADSDYLISPSVNKQKQFQKMRDKLQKMVYNKSNMPKGGNKNLSLQGMCADFRA